VRIPLRWGVLDTTSDMALHSDTLFWFRANQLFLLNAACGEATNTNFIVFGLTQPGRKPTIYHTRFFSTWDMTEQIVHWWLHQNLLLLPHSLMEISLLHFKIGKTVHMLLFILERLHFHRCGRNNTPIIVIGDSAQLISMIVFCFWNPIRCQLNILWFTNIMNLCSSLL
jgi:hypothetical protein